MLLLLLLHATVVLADNCADEFGKCGGDGWDGTTCRAGLVCRRKL